MPTVYYPPNVVVLDSIHSLLNPFGPLFSACAWPYVQMLTGTEPVAGPGTIQPLADVNLLKDRLAPEAQLKPTSSQLRSRSVSKACFRVKVSASGSASRTSGGWAKK